MSYRAQHSNAVAVIAGSECTAAIDAARNEIGSVRHFLQLCDDGAAPRPGWTDLSQALATLPDDDGAQHSTRASDPALVYYTSGTTAREP